MSKAFFGVSSMLFLVATLAISVGCEGQKTTADSVRSDMSPEMQSVAMTPQQRQNLHARSINTDIREISDDWDSLWLLDRPRQMSLYPVPNR